MRSTLSIYGLWLYDNTIFDEFKIPDRLDRKNLLDNLLVELAELEVLYPDPEMIKKTIGIWSTKELPIWEKLIDTTEYEYDPIANYDRTEHHKEVETRDLNLKTASSADRVGSDLTESFGAGFNAEEPVFTGSDKTTLGSGTKGSSETDDTGTVTHELDIRTVGNIGVTTTQQMISQERENVRFNVSNVIINEFKQRFCLLIY